MRIDSITIINYRQYKNLEYTFNRATGVQNDMNIIIAKNGVGKSNFLNAITWCLYEEESHLQDKNKALPIVNMSTIEETQENGIMKVQVSINIDVNGEKQTILREATYLKKSHTQSKVHKSDSHVLIRRMLFDQSSGTNKLDNIYDDNARILIERLFPKGISQYFFFDNEQMNNYFTTNKGGAIEKAINEISKVTLIQSIINRLKSLESEYRVDLSSTDNIADKLRKEAEIKYYGEYRNKYLQNKSILFIIVLTQNLT